MKKALYWIFGAIIVLVLLIIVIRWHRQQLALQEGVPQSVLQQKTALQQKTGGSAMAATRGNYTFSLTYQGTAREYTVHIPPSYSGKTPVPVVIYLHGGGGNMQEAYKDGMATSSDKYGFILLDPQGTGTVPGRYTWNAGSEDVGNTSVDDVGFISAVIKEVETKYSVDTTRIYATGLSNGGAMAQTLGCGANFLAAIAPVAGSLQSGCHPVQPVSVMYIQGTDDPCHPIAGGQAECAPGILTFKPSTVEPTSDIVATWMTIDQCSASTETTYQNGGATCVAHPSCGGGSQVELCTVTGMGHTYPSGNQYLSARLVGPVSYDISFDQIWSFFKQHSL